MSGDDDYDMILKTVLIGDSGVGKSNILNRYIKNEFNFDSKATVGVEFGSKKFEINGSTIKAQIWDTAGQERYKSITNAYYKGAKGALLVFDITRKETFDSVDRWIPELKASGDEKVTILLIGNKCDLKEKRQVTEEDASNKAKLYSIVIIYLDIAYMETSAYEAINIDLAFQTMVNEIYGKFHKELEDTPDEFDMKNDKVVDLNSGSSNTPQKKKCC